ncbi:hypothetical protein ACFVWY_26745 [Streptomyces sp. NPDC058195]|uniref:hypothetical protein n=1 Tax=Streptomyces sp. NPDC058195 TaxID=3346375 RepID=UPI0036E2DD83
MTLTSHQAETAARPRVRALAAYYAAALAIRVSDAGMPVAVVLVTLDGLGRGGAAFAGLLAACLTFPHMLGPLSARAVSLLPSARSGLVTAFALFAVSFLAAGVFLHQGNPLPAAAALLVTGFCGPIATGALSSHLGALLPDEQRAQRRAQSADSLTYAVSNSVGNSLVGAVAALLWPLATVFVLASLAALASLLVSFMPLEETGRIARGQASMKNVLLATVRIRQLRAISIITYGNFIGYAALVVLSTSFARERGLPASTGPLLLSVMGAGSLLVAGWFVVRPLDFDVVRTAKWCAMGGGAAMVVPAFGDVWVTAAAFLVVGGCQALLNTAALAVRREASPPELRESVFVTMAGIKIGMGTLGLALAGLLPSHAMSYGFVAAGVLTIVAGAVPRSAK